jgi:MFS superfamily sulfate permease-like transporter
MKWIDLSLGLSAFLSGLYGGTGFFIVMGGNPAITHMSDRSFAEFWQHLDHYMAARMPVFGPVLMLSLLLSVILLFREAGALPTWLMLIALVIIIGDLVFTLSVNHPYNRLIQSWDLENLPPDVRTIRDKVVDAFYIRILFMIGAFMLVILSAWLRRSNQ